MTLEAGLQPPLVPSYPTLSVAKVIGIHRHAGTIDAILLNGGSIAKDVPVLGWGGSTFGMAGLMAPTVTRDVLTRKTYDKPLGDFLHPAANTANFRDLYVLIGQAEGSQRGLTGLIALGFLFPQVSEMHFLGDTYPDFLLFRHPSDVQVTVDQWGAVAIQHPAGGHLLLDNAPKVEEGQAGASSEEVEQRPQPVDLTAQDFDSLYQLRSNLKTQVPVAERKPQFFVRIPRWLLGDEESAGGGTVEAFPGSEATTPASFATRSAPPEPMADTARIAILNGVRAEIVRTGALEGGLTAVLLSPPLPSAPKPGDAVEYRRVKVIEAGEVYHWFSRLGHAYLYAVWEEETEEGEVIIHGKIMDEAGELHQEHVQAGDIIEAADAAKDSGGNIRNYAAVDWEARAQKYATLHSVSGAKVQATPDGDINIIAPKGINIIAGGIVSIVGSLILENSGGGDSGAGQGVTDGQPAKSPGGTSSRSGSQGEGFPGMGGGGFPGMGGGMPVDFGSPFPDFGF